MTSEAIFDAYWTKRGKAAANYAFTDTRKLRGSGGKGFTNSRPSDRIVTFNRETFYAEVKSTTDEKSFSFSNIQPYQRGWARQTIAAGGLYFFFIHALALDQWFRVPAQVVLDAPKKSLRFDELTSYLWFPEL
jgi:penicillin-binding protein-related factor A (putative recombinase)